MSVFSLVMRGLSEGALWTLLGIGIAWVCLPNGWHEGTYAIHKQGIFRNDFARRYDGACAGWNHGMAVQSIRVELETWLSYCTIAFVLLRLHPSLRTIWAARPTLLLMFGFIVMCGIGHLIEAYCTLNPVYPFKLVYDEANAIVGYTAAVFIAMSLVMTFAQIAKQRAKLEAALGESA